MGRSFSSQFYSVEKVPREIVWTCLERGVILKSSFNHSLVLLQLHISEPDNHKIVCVV